LADPVPEPLTAARQLLAEGKYAEAEEAFAKVPADAGPEVTVGRTRALASSGQRDKAEALLGEAIKKFPKSSSLPAELAKLALARGDHARANDLAAAALALDGRETLATWVQAEVLCSAGKLDEANAAFKRLVDEYNDAPDTASERLQWTGLAAAQFARWNRLSEQFTFLVNEFYPDLLAADKTCWQAHLAAGQLYAEKYNHSDATKEFNAALAINPNAAEVHAAIGQLALEAFEIGAAQAAAERALEINPELLAAWQLRADIHLANFDPRAAAVVLADGLKLHPTSEATLGRLAAAYLSVDGVDKNDATSRFGKLAAEVNARNPHAGVFYETLADALDKLRRWPAAAGYYQVAIERMPQLIGPPGQLGMMLMRLGDEDRAQQVLDEAFRIDPFNVRVNNSLKVLEVLAEYQTLETEHFRIKYDPSDAILAQYMGQWLEEVYPDLVRQMGFTPPGKSLFEVFSKAKNTDGHGWFSARMVGLPHIHPIGACAGKIVALQSPTEGQQRFNWARVLKHEFIHVINLQQTEFNIPHWFTEALAVLNEGYPRPQSWNELLAAGFANKKLFDLDTINLGFIRPHSSAEWTLAYCQAELYAEYLIERFGDDAIAKMLSGYRDNLTTPEVLERAFATSQVDFESGYREYVAKVVAGLPAAARQSEPDLAATQKALAANPRDPALHARLAQAQLGRRNYPQARRSADAALAIEPNNALASYVRARLHLLVGENIEALERLERALDRDHPQENLLALLAGLKLKSEDYAAAAELYELGAKGDPGGSRWLKSLAAVYLKSGDTAKLAPVLVKLAEADPDDLTVRKKLAELARRAGDHPGVERWTQEALHIDVRDVEIHSWRAEALAARGAAAAAAKEYAVAVELDPELPALRLAQAQMHLQASQPDKARAVLKELLEHEPNDRAAAELLEKIK